MSAVLVMVSPLALGSCTLLPTPLPPAALLPLPTTAPGGPAYAHVLFVRATEESGGTWRFEVTVQRPAESEQAYADSWELLIPLPDGRTLSYTRPIAQSHQGQPFETLLSGIAVPAGTTRIQVRAHDSQNGYGGQEVAVNLSSPAGPGFQVIHK